MVIDAIVELKHTSSYDNMTFEESQIQSMFAGSTVLVTGGTGFIGKLLIEKLLR